MDEELKKGVAVFRYGVIADFVGGRTLSRGEKERLIRDKCEQKWQIPGSSRSRIGRSTLKEWIARYRKSGGRVDSLYPQQRADKGGSRTIEGDVAAGLVALRKELPAVSLPVLLAEAQGRRIILPGMKVSYSSLYRFLKGQGLLHNPARSPADRRKFEAEHPNDLWQSDIMHGPSVEVAGKKRKTYLIAFIDDMSRLVQGQFYLHERLENFLDALKKALLMRGLPRKLYVDNGSAFRSLHLEHTCASLGIVLIHSKAYQPEGRGKIERFFKTVRGSFLSPYEATTLEALNDEFRKYLTAYNESKHSATGRSPLQRFSRGIECIRVAPRDLEEHFRKSARRTVAKDRTLALNKRLYEAPVELVGKQVRLLYHEDDPQRVEVFFEGKTYGFVPLVDVHVNCRIKRGAGITRIETDTTPGRYQKGSLFSPKRRQK